MKLLKLLITLSLLITAFSRADQELWVYVIDKTPLGLVCANLGPRTIDDLAAKDPSIITEVCRVGVINQSYLKKPRLYIWRNTETMKYQKGNKFKAILSDSHQTRNYMNKPLSVYFLRGVTMYKK